MRGGQRSAPLPVSCILQLPSPPASVSTAYRRAYSPHFRRAQDAHGLHLYSKGNVPDASGSVAEIVAHAQVLAGDDGAVVRIESAQRVVLLSKSDGVTTALFMAGGS